MPKLEILGSTNLTISSSSQQRQEGMALLTILLLVVAITVVAGSMIASQGIMVRQYGLLLTQDQLLQDIKAGEQIAVDLIQSEAQINNTDSLQDAWAQPLPAYQLEQHQITLTIRDEASRFNLNNLYHDGKTDEVALGALQRLLTQLGLDSSLAYTLLDWQDPDNDLAVGEGQETQLYTDEGIIITNQPFVSVDALYKVSGFDADSVALIKPYLTAVPYYLPINVNTADAILLAALIDETSDRDARNNGIQDGASSLYQDTAERQVFESVDSYLATLPPLTSDDNENDEGSGTQTQSNDDGDVDENTSVSQGETQNNKSDEDQAQNREALAQLLSVDSQAFGVLIDVTVEDKHRYATSFVSKISPTSGFKSLPYVTARSKTQSQT